MPIIKTKEQDMRTIPRLFEDSVATFGNNPFMWEKSGEDYSSISYRKTKKLVLEMAAGFHAAGVKKGEG